MSQMCFLFSLNHMRSSGKISLFWGWEAEGPDLSLGVCPALLGGLGPLCRNQLAEPHIWAYWEITGRLGPSWPHSELWLVSCGFESFPTLARARTYRCFSNSNNNNPALYSFSVLGTVLIHLVLPSTLEKKHNDYSYFIAEKSEIQRRSGICPHSLHP